MAQYVLVVVGHGAGWKAVNGGDDHVRKKFAGAIKRIFYLLIIVIGVWWW